MSGGRRSRRKSRPGKTAAKLVQAATAKTAAGRANYLVDAVFDEMLESPGLDELAHFLVELALTRGSAEERTRRWLRKALKYRRR